MKRKLLCVLIVFVMIIGILPCHVFAAPAKTFSLQAGNYGTFTSGADVISSMIKKHGENGHPRIIMTNDKFTKLKSHLNDGSTTAKLLAKLKEEADSKKNSNEPINYELVGGIRILEQSKRVQRRVAALALAYNIFGDEKYAKSCYAELENAANFPDWNPYHFLDTGEMCTAFAIGYDWLYNWMNDTQRNFLRKAMIKKGLDQVMKDYRGEVKFSETRGERGDGNLRSYVWYNSTEGDNWQYVCIGGTNMAALAIGDESDSKQVASDVLTYGYKKAYTSVRAGYKSLDGTFIEGLGYWDYATYYLGFISSSLKSTTGTDYGLVNHDGVRKSVDFVRCMSSNAPKSFSFGDDNDGTDTRWPVFLWLGENYKSRDMANVRLKKIAEGTGFDYLDVLWIDESLNTGTQNSSPDDWGGKNYSNASFRNTWDKTGIVAALHAGENNYLYHGHFDLGSFYVESNGNRFITDLGNEKNYELNNRINAYRIRTEGHNTLVLNPTEDPGPGQPDKVTCLVTAFQSGKEAYAVTDLTEAYKASGAKRVVRGLKMIKDKKCVIVQDEISLNAAGEIYWFAHTKGSISVASGGRSAVITVGSDKLWVGILSEGGKFTSMKAEPLPSTPSVPGQSDNSEYRKLAIHLTNTKDTVISVACIPLKSGETKPSWTPSGITDFGSSMSHYEHKLAETAAKDPTCTANGNIRYWKCSVCGKLFSDASGKNEIKTNDTVLPALGHDLEHVAAKEPTDEEDGNIEYYVCKREGCGKKFADADAKTELKDADIIIPKKGAAVLGEEATVGNFIYRVTNPATDGTGTVTLIGVATKTAGVSIPASVEIKEHVYAVNRIGPKAFYKNLVIRTLTIGSNVKIIDSYAFYGCKYMTKVYGGARLQTIGSYAFAYCSKLKSFTITSSALKKISSYTFKKDKKLKTIKIKYTTKLTKSGVKKSLKKSYVKTVKVKKSKIRSYRKIFKKSNSGRYVRVKK